MNFQNILNRMNVRSNEKCHRIYQAVVEMVCHNGLHNTPMSKLSKKAGVAVGVIYHYFDSKEEIIQWAYLEAKKQILEAALSSDDSKHSTEGRFRNLWINSYKYFVQNPSTLSFLDQCSCSPLGQAVEEQTQSYIEPVLNILQTGIDEKILKPIEIDYMLSMIYGSVLSAARYKIFDKCENEEVLIQNSVQFCWDGLKL